MIEIYGCDEWEDVPCQWLEEMAEKALPLCLEHPGTSAPVVLRDLDTIEISLISDEDISRVHAEFLDDPSPTDVITFHHGELLVSVDTARSEAAHHRHSVQAELLLYIIHGLLHLNGHSDHEEGERTAMHAIQDDIWKRLTTPEPG